MMSDSMSASGVERAAAPSLFQNRRISALIVRGHAFVLLTCSLSSLIPGAEHAVPIQGRPMKLSKYSSQPLQGLDKMVFA